MQIVRLDKRFRRMNLFDVGGCIVDGIEYLEEILESSMNATKEDDKILYMPLIIGKLKTDGFTEEDYRNRVLVVCESLLDTNSVSKFLERFFKGFTVKQVGEWMEVEFCCSSDASRCLCLSNKEIVFYRPKRYIELPNEPDVKINGSKYCQDTLCIENKIIIGPLDVNHADLRDALDRIAPLRSFRVCENPMYFTFSFLDDDFCDAFVRVTSHIYMNDCKCPLISKKAYDGCVLLDLGRNIPRFAPRRLAGRVALSKERTRIVILLNVISSCDDVTEDFLHEVEEQCKNCGDIRSVVIPALKHGFKRQPGSSTIFIECGDVETSENVYREFGGLMYDERIVIAGYYPEMNYVAGEYE
ncbi:hypothetical protein CWI42_011820 [Ordospora colligata]|uniref:Uncharacterized protein n=1 Tax=Ordospora colligata OC4 TaxID=1354746 RepID=A0A0B2UN81_9MICR|nr:uncharacterized protein M896_011820 [Ordospora colligata OC4]KHN70527.1 hypothetical protein M896_011820 [Ordospora colligata OC4]TBU17277.1 hypothetical protein CWI41_011820 [Ordospora colligata]TBU17527.1 hypothetical protein CWI40_011820 [Ordospora colligata]TBU19707.1 hypothetical protein CWI42_011820 [Ordospora colligata]